MSDIANTLFTILFVLFMCYIIGINIYKYYKLKEQKNKLLDDEFSKLPKD